MKRAIYILSILALTILSVPAAHAASLEASVAPSAFFSQLAKLTASDGHPGDYFASSVAVDGNTLVAGDPLTFSGEPGAAYVFVKPAAGWANITQNAKLTTSDGAQGVGSQVAISGNVIVAVGLAGVGSTVYVWVKPDSGWSDMTETAKLTAMDPEGPASFFSVAISGNTVVAGNPNATTGAGAAYVWVKPSSGWTNMAQTARLTASDGGGNLGSSVAISGNAIVAGAQGADSFRGAAYVFVEPSGGWADVTQTAKLTSSDQASELGFSVAIDANTVVAGTLGGPEAYVFVEPATAWANMTETAKLTRSDQAQVGFGFSVAISGNTVVVGAPGSPTDLGAGYVFVRPATGWANMTETAKVISSDGAAEDLFGFSAAINGNTVVVGDPVPRLPDDTALAGAAYVFSFGSITLSPSSLNFGAQLINTTSSPKSVTLTNTGTVTLDISSIVASGSFSQTNNCGSSVLSGLSCTITVTFRPTKTSTCAETGALIVTDTSGGVGTVKLSGAGSVMTVSVRSLNFGNQPAGTTSAAKTITMTNHATSRVVSIAAITISGLNSPAFAQTNTCGTSLAAGASCTVSVTFTPHSKGSKAATLNVWNNGGAAALRVSLSGNGT